MAGKSRTFQGITLPAGVRIRGRSVQIFFSWCGEQQQITLKDLGVSEADIEFAGVKVFHIKQLIRRDQFEWADHFPDHKYAKARLELPANTLISKLLINYIAAAETELAGVTWDNYSYYTHNFLIPAFGGIPVADFTAGHARQWVKENQHLSRSTLNSYLAPLRSALREAVLDGQIKDNVLDRFVWPKESKKVREDKRQKIEDGGDDIDPFNQKEITAILNACKDREQERNMIGFGFWSGLRLEELFALKWGDVDWVNGTVRIRRALVKRKGYGSNGSRIANHIEIKGLKTDGSGIRQRDLVLMPGASKALTAQKLHTFLMNDWVFHNPIHGTHWQGTNQFYNRWVRILQKAGVRHRCPYQMRHTWASTLIAAGEDEAWVAKMLGHVNTEMVRKTYRRFIPNGDGYTGYRFRNDWG